MAKGGEEIRKLKLRQKIIIWISVLLIVSGMIGLFMQNIRGQSQIISYGATDISSIEVTIQSSLMPLYYTNQDVFWVKEQENFNYILDTINNYSDKTAGSEEDGRYIEDSFSFTIYLKDGKAELHTIGGLVVSSDNSMGKVLGSKEVVEQIRRIYHINENEIASAVLYHWEETSSKKAITEQIENSELIKQAVSVAKKEAIENGLTTMYSTECGIELYYEDGEVVTVINISEGSPYFKEYVALFPQITEYFN